MPELPEVETIKRDLEKRILGLKVKEVVVRDTRSIQGLSTNKFISKFKNQFIKKIERRGKALIIALSSRSYLVIQLGMTGQVILSQASSGHIKETKVIFHLSNGMHMLYNDQRVFGRLIWTDDLSKIKYLTSIGPEPFKEAFSEHWLKVNLKRRTSPIKTLLMNSTFVAGIGNIYASEILFEAGINPNTKADKLNSRQVAALRDSTRSVLREAIKSRGTSMRNFRDASGAEGKFMKRIKVYGRANQPCLRCEEPIQRIVQGGRSSFFCPACQS